ALCRIRIQLQSDVVPGMDADIRMVILALGDLTDLVDERERIFEVLYPHVPAEPPVIVDAPSRHVAESVPKLLLREPCCGAVWGWMVLGQVGHELFSFNPESWADDTVVTPNPGISGREHLEHCDESAGSG